MTLDLAFTPSGRITVQQSDRDREGRDGDNRDEISDGRLTKVIKAFQLSPAEGLFALATQRLDTAWSPSLGYWRDFAARYLSELCHTPVGTSTHINEIPPPGSGELASMLLCVPPMPGAEYISSAEDTAKQCAKNYLRNPFNGNHALLPGDATIRYTGCVHGES
jgi:hypothetical protein